MTNEEIACEIRGHEGRPTIFLSRFQERPCCAITYEFFRSDYVFCWRWKDVTKELS